jgi:hypothetical protein
MRRRSFIAATGAVASGALAPAALRAQGAKDFPNKPITLIMPWPAGSGSCTTLPSYTSGSRRSVMRTTSMYSLIRCIGFS